MIIYYVKNGGSNSNTGLSDEQAFATPEHAHSISVPGDKILLKRGSKWFGFTPQKAGTNADPIIWDAYGEGEKPIIHGLKTITGWTDIGGGFWKVTDTDILTRSKFIKIDNSLSTVARSPRTNYYQSTGATGSTAGTVTDTGFLNGKDFTGGEVVFRKNNWIVDTMLITAHSGSTIDYSGGSTTNAVTGWGYAIQNHRDVCTEELDWCQEEDDIVIYFDNIDPTSVTVEVPVIEKIDFASRGYNFFNNIVFEGFNGGSDTTNENPCFLLSASQQVKFLAGCEFKNMGNTVFYFIANNNNGFELNGISAKDCLNIFLWNRHSSTTPQFEIINSEFEDIGNVLGAGGNGPNGYSCIIFAGSSGPCTVSGNRLKNIGYNAINFGGFEYIVEKNVVENSCSQMADGGSYYTFGKSDVAKTYVTANRILRKNVAIDSPGNAYGTPLQFSSGHPTSYMSEGIYLDDDSKNITIEDNYATGCRAGLKCQNNKDHIFSGNIFHKNISIQCLFANNNNGAFDIENINFQNNILYSNAGQLVIQFESKNNDFDIFGTFNNNYYMRPANEAGIIRHWCKLSGGSFDNLLSLLQWQETDQGEGVFYDVDTVGTPTNSTISNAYYNDSMEDAVVIDIERKRMDVDGDEVTNLTLDSFQSVLLLDDLGLLPMPIPYSIFHVMHPLVNPRRQKLIAAQNFENGEVVGKAYHTFTHSKFHKFYIGAETVGSDYSWTIVNGGNAFAINSASGEITIANISNFSNTTIITVRCDFNSYFETQEIEIIYVPTVNAIYLDGSIDPANPPVQTGSRTQPYIRARSVTSANRLGKTLFYKSGTETDLEYLGTFENSISDPWTQFARWGTGARPKILLNRKDGTEGNTTAQRFMDFGHTTDPARRGHNVRIVEIDWQHNCVNAAYPFQLQPYSLNFEMYNVTCTGTTNANGFVWCVGISSSLGAEAIPYNIASPDRIFSNVEFYDYRDQLGDGCRAIKFERGGNFVENIKATTTHTGNLSAAWSAVDMPGTYVDFGYMDNSSGISTRGPNIRTSNQTYKRCYVKGCWEGLAISNNDNSGWKANGFAVDGSSGFEHCIVENSTTSGVAFFNTENTGLPLPSETVKLHGIITIGCAAGVRFQNGCRNIDVTSSIFLRSTANGVRQSTTPGTGCRIINCLSLDSTGSDVLISTGSIGAINSIFQTKTGTVNETTCSINVSSFVNFATDDFRLAEGSPLIGAGTYIAGLKDLTSRDFLNPPSIGAFEFIVDPTPDIGNFIKIYGLKISLV
jgi:parallel beta-helix repeat protein